MALQGFLNETVDPIRDQIRPFSRQVQRPVKHLKQASQPLAQTANSTAGALSDINRLFNAWAYNPPGSEEGYLFWTAWLNHNANGAALLQDANGPLPRGVVLQSCRTARLAESLAVARPFIRTLQQYTNVPQSKIICPLDPSDAGAGSASPVRTPTGATMETRPPTTVRILVAVGFAISCFGLALFLWLAFGGPIPLKAEGYRFTVPFDEATQLAAGVGRADLRGLGRQGEDASSSPTPGYADATIELDAAYAPIPDDTRAILRQKTLLGETYVELTPGSDDARRRCPRAARCPAPRSPRRSSSTRSSAPSTSRPAPRSRPGCRARRPRCAVAATTSRSRSRACRRSPTRPTGCCACSTARTSP